MILVALRRQAAKLDRELEEARRPRHRRPPKKWQAPEGTGLVRFVSVPDFSSRINRFGSVRTKTIPGSTRFGLRFSDASWLGPIRFGSVPRPVPAGSRINRFGSVRPVRFGFLFLHVSPDRWVIGWRFNERKAKPFRASRSLSGTFPCTGCKTCYVYTSMYETFAMLHPSRRCGSARARRRRRSRGRVRGPAGRGTMRGGGSPGLTFMASLPIFREEQ